MADATRGPHAIAATGKALGLGQAEGRKIYPRGSMDRPPAFARAKRELTNIPGSKRSVKKVLRFDGRALSSFDVGISRPRMGTNASVTGADMNDEKPSKTAAELEASIKVEMEDICDWPTDMMISVQPDGDSWKAEVMQEGTLDDADRREMVEQIAARLKGEYDLKD
jgi:hypothetical protein